MNTSTTNRRKRKRKYLRRGHRWLGVATVAFILLLTVSGVALNHATDLGLERRFVAWNWLLDAYGITAPTSSESFAADGHRAIQLGERVYLDGREVAQSVGLLSGLVGLDGLLIIGFESELILLTRSGEVVERMDIASLLQAPLAQLGRIGDQVVVQAGGSLFISDTEIAVFDRWQGESAANVVWAVSSEPSQAEIDTVTAAYRGAGLSLERLVIDFHSGRFFGVSSTLLMDLIAALIIGLSLTGLYLSVAKNRKS